MFETASASSAASTPAKLCQPKNIMKKIVSASCFFYFQKSAIHLIHAKIVYLSFGLAIAKIHIIHQFLLRIIKVTVYLTYMQNEQSKPIVFCWPIFRGTDLKVLRNIEFQRLSTIEIETVLTILANELLSFEF